MKKRFLLLAASTLLLLAACGGDNNGGGLPGGNGQNPSTSQPSGGGSTPSGAYLNVDGTSWSVSMNQGGYDMTVTFSFNGNGNGVQAAYMSGTLVYSESFTYTQTGNHLDLRLSTGETGYADLTSATTFLTDDGVTVYKM